MLSTKILKVASVLDSAIDLDKMAETLVEYAKTRDEGLLKLKPGKAVTWFHIRRIPTSLIDRYVLEATSMSEQNRRAFSVAVIKAESLYTTDGRQVHALEPTGKIDTPAGKLSMWTEEELELFAPQYTQEIGSLARQRSFLVPGSAASLLLPPSSAEECRRRVYRVVAERGENAAQSSVQLTTEPPSNGTSTAGPTDANATASHTEQSAESRTGAAL
jgi:hypothetical protein